MAAERGEGGDSIYSHGRERSGLERKESRRENLGFGGEINSKTNPNSRRIQRDKTGFLGEEIEEDKGDILPLLILEIHERGGRSWRGKAAAMAASGSVSGRLEVRGDYCSRGKENRLSAGLLLLSPIEGGT